MNTLLAILKVTDARRDVIMAGGLYHRFPWRHFPPWVGLWKHWHESPTILKVKTNRKIKTIETEECSWGVEVSDQLRICVFFWMIVFLPFRDCIWNAFCNSGTSFYGGFLIFSILGFMAKHQGVEVKDVVQAGSFAHDLKKMAWAAMVEFINAKIYNIPEKERGCFHLRCTFVSAQ